MSEIVERFDKLVELLESQESELLETLNVKESVHYIYGYSFIDIMKIAEKFPHSCTHFDKESLYKFNISERTNIVFVSSDKD